MKYKIIATVALCIIINATFAQKDSDDTLKPYYVYVPYVTFDEDCYVNGNNWTLDGNYSLPCEIIDFIVVCDNNNTLFQWSTMTETNASHFNIQIIYPDGNEKISSNISASGNSNTVRYYETEMKEEFPIGTVVKLTQSDYDGKTHLMAVKSIEMRSEGNNISDFKIIKNQNSVSAVWKSDRRLNTSVSTYSIDGKLLHIWIGQSEKGLNYSSSFEIEKGLPFILIIETPYERESIRTVL